MTVDFMLKLVLAAVLVLLFALWWVSAKMAAILLALKSIKDSEEIEKNKLKQIQTDLDRLFGLDPRPGVGHYLSQVSRYVYKARHEHIRVSSKTIDGLAEGRLAQWGKQLVDYQRAKNDSFTLPLIDSTHEFMAEMAADLLTEDYAYVATSVLDGYGRVQNPSFQAFSRQLTEKVRDGRVCGVRLYYCIEAEPTEEKLREMKQAAAAGFQVRYLRVKKQEAKDFSLVYQPKSRVLGDAPREKAAVRIASNPNEVICEFKDSHELECGLKFEVERIGDDAQRVKEIRVLGRDNLECRDFVTHFNDDWRNGIPVQAEEKYSFFLSYGSEYRKEADELLGHLKRHGLYGWLDANCNEFGDFEEKLARCVDTIPVLVMLISPSGPTTWQWKEFDLYKSRYGKGNLAPAMLTSTVLREEWKQRMGEGVQMVTKAASIEALAKSLVPRIRTALLKGPA